MELDASARNDDLDSAATQLESGEIDLMLSDRELAVPDLPARILYRDGFVCLSSYRDFEDGEEIGLDRLCSLDHAFVDPTGGSFLNPPSNFPKRPTGTTII